MAAATLYARPPVQQGRLSTGARVPPPDSNANRDLLVTTPTCGDLQAPDNSKEFEKFHINCNCKLFATRYACKLFPLRFLHGRHRKLTHRHETKRLAAHARPSPIGRSIWLDCDPADRFAWQQAACVSRPRLPGRGRLHGSWQLGDVARRWVQVRIRAAHRCIAFEPDGHPAAGIVCASWDRVGT